MYVFLLKSNFLRAMELMKFYERFMISNHTYRKTFFAVKQNPKNNGYVYQTATSICNFKLNKDLLLNINVKIIKIIIMYSNSINLKLKSY